MQDLITFERTTKNMKKITITLLSLFIMTTSAQAQFEIEKLFGGINIGWATPQGDVTTYAQGGIAYNGFLGYKVGDKFGAGIQLGETLLGGIDSSGSTGFLGLNAFGISTAQLKGWYSPLDGDVKPFASIALGAATVEEPSVTINGEKIPGKTSTGFGGEAQAGVSFQGVTLTYACVLGGQGPEEDNWNQDVGGLAFNYSRISLGFIYNF